MKDDQCSTSALEELVVSAGHQCSTPCRHHDVHVSADCTCSRTYRSVLAMLCIHVRGHTRSLMPLHVGGTSLAQYNTKINRIQGKYSGSTDPRGAATAEIAACLMLGLHLHFPHPSGASRLQNRYPTAGKSSFVINFGSYF